MSKKNKTTETAADVGTVTPPEIARALAKREQEALDRKNRFLAVYRQYIDKAARGEPIDASDGDAAVLSAEALGIKASRIGEDVSYWARHLANERRREAHAATSGERRKRIADIRAELEIHERLTRELKAEALRIGADQTILTCANEQRELLAAAPHLFKEKIETLTDAEAAVMRRP